MSTEKCIKKCRATYSKKRSAIVTQKLGQGFTSARKLLLKKIVWDFIVKCDLNKCFRCGLPMSFEDYSLEHKVAWYNSEISKDLYFDLDNISYSHAKCNREHGTKERKTLRTHCKNGHEYTAENTRIRKGGARQCRVCESVNSAKWYRNRNK